MDRTGETADGGEMSKPESWRSDGAEYSRQHRPERFSDRSHRNPMRSHPYGRSYRPAGSQGYYNKPYYTRNTGGRDVGARSYLAGGRISRFPRREYRPGYVGAPEKLYYHGSSSRGFGMYPNIHRYASNLSQMFPLVNPPPLYLR